MSSELICLTGSSGFIGSNITVEALKRGYRLRLCLRKPSERLSLLLAPYQAQVEYVFIQNLADETAWRGHLDGANYVIHIASPVPHGTNKEYYFSAAVNITMALLREATRVPTIRKVVVTSSLAALTPLSGVPPGGIIKENNAWNFDVDKAADFTVPNNPTATALNLYHASKLLARESLWKFCEDDNPRYSLVVIHPGFIYGKNPMQITPEEVILSSNGGFWHAIMEGAPADSLNCVHIGDVVEAHLKALDPKVLHGSAYVLAPNKVTWKEVAEIVHRNYPDSGAKINRHMNGETAIPFMQVDCTKAEIELGMKWRSMEEMVHDVMDQQLELLKQSALTY